LKVERDDAVKDMSVAMKQHNHLVKDLKDKTYDVQRRERMSIMAIAARANIKKALDDSKDENIKLIQKIEA